MFESNTQTKVLKVARSTSGIPLMTAKNFLPSAKLTTTYCTQHVVQSDVAVKTSLDGVCMRGSIQRVFFYGVHWRTLSTFCIVSGKRFVTSLGIEMIDLANAIEGLTLSLAIQQTTRFTSTLSSMISWKFLLVVVMKTASMAPSLNVALDNHVGSLPSSTMDVVCLADSVAGTVYMISPGP